MLINIITVFGITGAILVVINRATTDQDHYNRIESAIRWSFGVTACALALYCMVLDYENGFIDMLLNVTYP